MFAKLQRQIDRKNKHKTPKKFRFDVTVSSLEGIPATIKSCRIVWTRGSRAQTTKTTPVINGKQHDAMLQLPLQSCKQSSCHLVGVAHWREALSQISTIYTDAKHAADVEEKVCSCYSCFCCAMHCLDLYMSLSAYLRPPALQ